MEAVRDQIISLESALEDLPATWNGRIEDAASGKEISLEQLAAYWSTLYFDDPWVCGYFRDNGDLVTPINEKGFEHYPAEERDALLLFRIDCSLSWTPEAADGMIRCVLDDMRHEITKCIQALR